MTARSTAGRLHAQNQRIEQQVRAKSLFLANLSHELRTPLNAVIGFADLLGSGAVPVDSPKQQQFLDHIQNSGRHLLQLINDVLEMSKLDAGHYEFFPEPVVLAQLVADVVDVLHTRLVRKSIAVDVQVDPTLARIVIDPARFKQALMSYLSNAVKVSPERGRIRVRALPEGPDRFRVEVEDGGPGLSRDELLGAFAEFAASGNSSRASGGVGLGLALTRRLVEAQGGGVGASSVPGAGSVFFLVMDRVHLEHWPVAEAVRDHPASTVARVSAAPPGRPTGARG